VMLHSLRCVPVKSYTYSLTFLLQLLLERKKQHYILTALNVNKNNENSDLTKIYRPACSKSAKSWRPVVCYQQLAV